MVDTGSRNSGIGNVRGASSNWRQLNTGGGNQGGDDAGRRVDLLASQRTQLHEYNTGPRLNESFGSNHSGKSIFKP